MPIAIEPDHIELAKSVRSLLNRMVPSQVLHASLETPVTNPPVYWKTAADQGLHGLHLTESVGGQGAGLLELAVVIAEFGYAAAPGPFVPSVIASALISAHDPASEVLTRLACGGAIAAFSLESDLIATRRGDTLVLRGQARSVPSAAQASLLVLPVAIDSAIQWAVIDASALEIAPLHSVDLLRPAAHVRADSADIRAGALLSTLSPAAGRAIGATLLSAEAVGVAGWATDAASAYAKIREQFNRPIGQFQAIKHKCAEMVAATERATAAVWDAARALDEAAGQGWDDAESHYEFAAAVAATLAPETAQRCAQDCIQVHGGIGFTWEHDANIYYRRILGLVAAFGGLVAYPQLVFDTATRTGVRPVRIDLDSSTEDLREDIRSELTVLKTIPPNERNAALGDGGWVQPHLPKPWGRAAAPIEQIIIAQELSAARITLPRMGMSWLIPSIVAFGTEEQQRRFIPPALRGEVFWCQLFSEPGAGSDLASLATKAAKVEGGWVITGQKIWTTGAHFAQWGALLARTDPSVPKHQGITYFLLDMKSPGVEIQPLRELTGNAMFNTVFLDGVFVPDELVVGEVNRGWQVSRNTLAAERVSIGSDEPGHLPSLKSFVEFLGGRLFDHVQRDKAGHLIAEGHAVTLMNTRSTLLTLTGGDAMPAAAISKLFSMRTGQGYAEFAVSSLGIDAAIGDPSEQQGRWTNFLLASRATTIYGGTSEIQLNIIAERMLGLPRDP
jgi:alkylation response protein AidB-like acyl-CoA dehydrogenase